MNRILVKLPNNEPVGYLATNKTYTEIEKIYLILRQEYEDTRDLIDAMCEEYDMRFIEFDDDCLILD